MSLLEVAIYENYEDTEPITKIRLSSIKNVNLCGSNPRVTEDFEPNKKCLFTLTTDDEKYYCGFEHSILKNPMTSLAESFFDTLQMVFLPFKSRDEQIEEEQAKKTFSEMYKINLGELLGSGNFGKVFGGQERATNKQVAIKIITKNMFAVNDDDGESDGGGDQEEISLGEIKSQFANEAKLLSSIQHPGILKLLAVFDEENHVSFGT